MRKWRQVVLASVVSLLASGWTAPSQAAATQSDEISALATRLGRLPDFEDVALSPQATRLAFARTDGDVRIVSIYSFAEQKITYALRVGAEKLRSLFWADDDHLLIETSTTAHAWGLEGGRDEWWMAQVVNARTKRAKAVDVRVEGLETMNVILDTPEVRQIKGRTKLLVVGYYNLQGTMRQALFSFDPDNQGTTVLAKSDASRAQWLVSDEGAVLASIECYENSRRWALKVRKGDRLVPTDSGESLVGWPKLAGLSQDGSYGVVGVPTKEGSDYRQLSLVDGKIGEPYAEGRGLRSFIHATHSQRIIGGVALNSLHYRFFDKDRQKAWNAIATAYAGANLSLESNSDDFRKLVVLVDGAELGYYYELFDLDARRGTPIGNVYAGVKQVAPATDISYPASDGMNIPAVVTMPRGVEPKNLPLVVLAHGGPASYVTRHFDWWREALAEQGYVVLEPNFRGSSLSWELESAGFGEWGRKMQSDLSDGVRYLVKNGTVDAKRVCVVGASYGGYAALAGATLDLGVYRCAVSVAGLADLRRWLQWENDTMSVRNNSVGRYWDRYLGATGPNDPLLTTLSPVNHVAAVDVPVLLIHGKDDTVVPFDQSEVMLAALKKAGKQVEFIVLKHEDHWLSSSDTRSQMLDATLRFLDKNNPAR